jgi:uncharacterized repeat protein (TIGR01451 family)
MKFGLPLTRLALLCCLGPLRLLGSPIITDFSPKFGAPGDSMNITGQNFMTGTMTVRFSNGVIATDAFVSSDNLIIATVPNGAVTGTLSIQQDSGQIFPSTASFTVIGPGPYISGISPNLGGTDDQVVISGAHFLNTTAVSFHGVSVGNNFVPNADGTTLTTYVPAGATTGPISVTTPAGTSNSAVFTVIGPGPYITSFSPTIGNDGSPVSIVGRFFTGVTNVQFNGVSVPGFSGPSGDNQINVAVPAGASSGPITLKAPLGNYTTPTNFYMPPSITGLSPSSGGAGDTVVISGNSFIGVSSVSFNGVLASYRVNAGGNQITSTVPNTATSGNISVVAPAGSAQSARFTVLPKITSFSPGGGPVGQGVTINGYNLSGAITVKFNGTSASIINNTATQISVSVPLGATTGPISVTTADGTSTSAASFYLPPSITSFSPNSGTWNSPITINGKGFTGVTSVQFAGTSAFNFNVISDTSISANPPYPTVTSGPISVTGPAGTVYSTNNFYGPPSITGFSPTHGLPNNQVLINGANFLDATAVYFGSSNSPSFTVVNNGQIFPAYVPNKAQTGPITVVTPGGTAVSSANFVLDYSSDLYPTPTVSPNPVWVGSNLVYTISIYNNSSYDAPNVRITNTLPSSVTLVSAYATQGSLVTNTTPITGNLGTVPSFALAYVTFTVVPHTGGMITNTVSIGSDYPDPVPGNNTAIATARVMSIPVLGVKLQSAPKQVSVFWPADLYDYVLQSKATVLTNSSWVTVTNARQTNASSIFVTQTNFTTPRFFRLSR